MSNAITTQATPGTALTPDLSSLAQWSEGRIAAATKALYVSGLATSAEEALARMLVADALGVHPIIGVMNIHLMEASGKKVPIVGVHLGTAKHQQMGGTFKVLESTALKCSVKAEYLGTEYTSTWTPDRLKPKDKRINKDDQSQLLARAKVEAIRAVNPAAFFGVYTAEEIQDQDAPATPREPQKAEAELVQDTPAQKPAEPQKAEAATQETAANFAVNIDGQGQVTQPTKAATAMPKAVQNALYNAIVSLSKMDQAKTEAVVKDFCRGLADIYSLSRQQVWQMMERMAFAFPDFEVPNVWPDDEEVFA
jgi:hypothetical protein